MQKVVIYERGFVHDKIPSQLFKELLNSLKLEDIDSKPNFANFLAGNIEIEKSVGDLIPFNFLEYLSFLANEYCNNFRVNRSNPHYTSKQQKEFIFSAHWLNYQKKYEFNPCHDHQGTLSYVTWLQIPYELEQELALPNNLNSGDKCNSMFDFVGDDFNFPIAVDKKMVGDIIIFPSSQRHQVYPFYTSDEYRISMSGNITVNLIK